MRTLKDKLKPEYTAELDKVKAEAPSSYKVLIESLEAENYIDLKVMQLMDIIYWLMPPFEREYDIFKATEKLFEES